VAVVGTLGVTWISGNLRRRSAEAVDAMPFPEVAVAWLRHPASINSHR